MTGTLLDGKCGGQQKLGEVHSPIILIKMKLGKGRKIKVCSPFKLLAKMGPNENKTNVIRSIMITLVNLLNSFGLKIKIKTFDHDPLSRKYYPRVHLVWPSGNASSKRRSEREESDLYAANEI